MSSEGVFYTDANGREFQRRVRNERPTWDLNVTQPIASNYYPVTAAAFVRDEAGDNEGVQVRVLGGVAGVRPGKSTALLRLCSRFPVDDGVDGGVRLEYDRL